MIQIRRKYPKILYKCHVNGAISRAMVPVEA